MTDNDGRSEAQQAAIDHQADAMFEAEIAELAKAFRGMVQQSPDERQARADLQAYAAEEYAPEVLAALLSQAVSRIVDLEDLASL